jgi:hypothetical protein
MSDYNDELERRHQERLDQADKHHDASMDAQRTNEALAKQSAQASREAAYHAEQTAQSSRNAAYQAEQTRIIQEDRRNVEKFSQRITTFIMTTYDSLKNSNSFKDKCYAASEFLAELNNSFTQEDILGSSDQKSLIDVKALSLETRDNFLKINDHLSNDESIDDDFLFMIATSPNQVLEDALEKTDRMRRKIFSKSLVESDFNLNEINNVVNYIEEYNIQNFLDQEEVNKSIYANIAIAKEKYETKKTKIDKSPQENEPSTIQLIEDFQAATDHNIKKIKAGDVTTNYMILSIVISFVFSATLAGRMIYIDYAFKDVSNVTIWGNFGDVILYFLLMFIVLVIINIIPLLILTLVLNPDERKESSNILEKLKSIRTQAEEHQENLKEFQQTNAYLEHIRNSPLKLKSLLERFKENNKDVTLILKVDLFQGPSDKIISKALVSESIKVLKKTQAPIMRSSYNFDNYDESNLYTSILKYTKNIPSVLESYENKEYEILIDQCLSVTIISKIFSLIKWSQNEIV